MQESSFISFRDHDARVTQKDGQYYRLIYHTYKNEYDHLMQSGLYDELLQKKLIIPHKEIPLFQDHSNVYKCLHPKQLSFISYPYEWTTSNWFSAIKYYLKINLIAFRYGMILKDATPFNFCFLDGQPILFDTSSFIFYKENDPWIAYRQFCEEWLGPLALIHFRGSEWIGLMQQKGGLTLPFISKHLPRNTWLRLSTLIHIHLHSRFYGSSAQKRTEPKGLTKEKIELLHRSLLAAVTNWQRKQKKNSHWVNYYAADLESNTYLAAKEKIIKDWLQEIKPKRILDLGANTGHFSQIGCQYANEVIAIESDHDAAESVPKTPKLQTVLADITTPSPGNGFMNKEMKALLERSESDMVFGLALIHHLSITKRLALNQVAQLFDQLSTRYVIVEFIPEEDSKVLILKQASIKNYINYSETTFRESFEVYFKIKEEKIIEGSNRKLFLMEKL